MEIQSAGTLHDLSVTYNPHRNICVSAEKTPHWHFEGNHSVSSSKTLNISFKDVLVHLLESR